MRNDELMIKKGKIYELSASIEYGFFGDNFMYVKALSNINKMGFFKAVRIERSNLEKISNNMWINTCLLCVIQEITISTDGLNP